MHRSREVLRPLSALLLSLSGCGGADTTVGPLVVAEFRPPEVHAELAALVGPERSFSFGADVEPWSLGFKSVHYLRRDAVEVDASTATVEEREYSDGELVTRYSTTLSPPLPEVEVRVVTRWRENPARDGLRGSIEVELEDDELEGHYLSWVRFPRLELPAFGEGDVLSLPWVGGFEVAEPATEPLAIAAVEPGVLSFPACGLRDRMGEVQLYLSNTDAHATLKRVRLTSDPEARTLLFEVQQHPEEPRTALDYESPYEVEVALTSGDWFDVAERYRGEFAAVAPWYAAALERGTPPALAEARWFGAFHALPGTPGEIANEVGRLLDQWGPGVPVWYDVHAPDEFDCFYKDGYLPGVPGLAEAIAAARTNTRAGAAFVPYVMGSIGWDPWNGAPAALDEPDVQAESAVLLEVGKRFTALTGTCENVFLCPGTEWWANELPATVAALDEAFGIDGVYLDLFAFPGHCFDPAHPHPTGNGSWLADAKLEQVRAIRERLGPERPIAMESVLGRFSEELDLMFVDPFVNTTRLPDERVRSVPMFRVAWPNVRLATLEIHAELPAARSGLVAYRQAYRMVACGLLLSTGTRPALRLALGPNASRVGDDPRYREYLDSLVGLFELERFGDVHAGHLLRAAEVTFTPGGRADLRRVGGGPLFHAPGGATLYPHGLFAAADGSAFAFVVTNPWIGDCPWTEVPPVCDYNAVVPTAALRGARGPFVARGRSTGGDVLGHAGVGSDTLRFVGRLERGETHLWWIEPLRPPR